MWAEAGKIWSSIFNVHLRRAVENRLFPHFLFSFQWVLLVSCLAFNLNFSVATTGAVANGGLKTITFFPFWMLFFSVVSALFFFRVRKKDVTGKNIGYISLLTAFFSVVNISFHFANGWVLLMKITEVIAWVLFNFIFSLGVYRISNVSVLPTLRKHAENKKVLVVSDDRKVGA